jgi:hypothetical protein
LTGDREDAVHVRRRLEADRLVRLRLIQPHARNRSNPVRLERSKSDDPTAGLPEAPRDLREPEDRSPASRIGGHT